MASVTVSKSASRRARRALRPPTGQWPLTRRIMAVNIFTVLVLAFGVIYLDTFRDKLSEERLRRTEREAQIGAIVANSLPPAERARGLAEIGHSTGSRIRLYGKDGRLIADSWALTGPTYRLRDPAQESWMKDAARALARLTLHTGTQQPFNVFSDNVHLKIRLVTGTLPGQDCVLLSMAYQ